MYKCTEIQKMQNTKIEMYKCINVQKTQKYKNTKKAKTHKI